MDEMGANETPPTVPPGTRPKLSPKTKFRAIVRLVMANLPWLMGAGLRFGGNLHKKRNAMNMDLEIKTLLNKPPENRTEEENEIIYKTIGSFKFYRKYPEHIKRLLADYTQFVYYGADRTIVRSDNYATAIFYILNGEVNIIDEKYDNYLKETQRTVRETLCPGDVFGELCLLHDLPRMETIVSITPIEFLILKREHFDLVLRGTMREEWDRISHVMQMFDYFKDWDTLRIGECCMQSFLNTYAKGDIILGDGYGRPEYVHFVIEGRCTMIEHFIVKTTDQSTTRKTITTLTSLISEISNYEPLSQTNLAVFSETRLRKSRNEGGEELKQQQPFANSWFITGGKQSTVRKSLHNMMEEEEEEKAAKSRSSTDSKKDTRTIYMQVCVFGKKASFSLGETMINRRIVADKECVCMLIPSFLLLGRDCLWLQIKQYIDKQIPNSDTVFNEYLQQHRWRQYKQELIAPLVSKQSHNWHANIPYTIRVRKDFDYQPKKSDPYGRQEILKRIRSMKT